MRLFLDANVLFTAAHNPHGRATLVVELGEQGLWELVTSALAVEEAGRNLEIKFPVAVRRFASLLDGIDVLPTVPVARCPIELPAKDRPILLSAMRARCSHLLTGDLKHFGRFMNRPDLTKGLIIQTVRLFLESL